MRVGSDAPESAFIRPGSATGWLPDACYRDLVEGGVHHMRGTSEQHARLASPLVWILAGSLLGCSTLSITYNYADWLILWRVDGYFDLSAQQEAYLERRLAVFHTRHRQEALPRYAAFLRQIRVSWHDGLTPDEIESIFQRYLQLRADLFHAIASDGARFLATIDQVQLQRFEEALQRENQRLVKRVSVTPQERLTRRTEASLDWLEDWFGQLTPEQAQHGAHLIRELPDTTEAWLAHRERRQQELVQLLQSKESLEARESGLRNWLLDPEQSATPEYQQAMQRWRTVLKWIVWEIDQTITWAQRAHALEKLDWLAREIEGLASA